MKRGLPFLLIGIFFGIVMTKSEAVSWFRIQEMFRFQSFHMYGIIGVAVVVGAIVFYLIKRLGLKNKFGEKISIKNKAKNYTAAILGGTIFGFGWALTGACPGPIYVLIGHGYLVFILVLFFALIGALSYRYLKDYLPH